MTTIVHSAASTLCVTLSQREGVCFSRRAILLALLVQMRLLQNVGTCQDLLMVRDRGAIAEVPRHMIAMRCHKCGRVIKQDRELVYVLMPALGKQRGYLDEAYHFACYWASQKRRTP